MTAPADGCGNCITEERSVTVQPHLTQPDGEGGVRAWYRCGECGHRWWTSWLAGAGAAVSRGAA